MNLKFASHFSLLLITALVGSCGIQEPSSESRIGASAFATIATQTTSSTLIPTTTRAPDQSKEARGPGEVRREDFGEKWPLTVDAGVVQCRNGAVTFTSNGFNYDVNGTAMTRNRGKKIDEIWADDPKNAGLKINIGPIIDFGLKLC